MADVHIVGGGPCGSVAAITAAREGNKVILSEEHARAGIPENCSGLFSESGLLGLSDFLDYRKFVINSVSGARIFFGDEMLLVKAKRTMGHVCNRADFDKKLALTAEDEGVEVEYGKKINGDFSAENIIGADGPLSHVAAHFDFPRIGRFVGTMQAVMDYRTEDKDIVEVYVSPKLAPGFFGWIIPHNDEKAELGIGVELPNNVHDAWKRFLKIKGVQSARPNSSSIIPVEQRSRSAMKIAGKRVVLAGDAAGQVKATTGGGVIFGTSCAMLAGRFFRHPSRYEFEWRFRHGADLGAHRLIRDALNLCPDDKLRLLARKLKDMRIGDYLSDYGNMDRPLLMLRPEILLHTLKAVLTNGR